jgi:hypothetical protein
MLLDLIELKPNNTLGFRHNGLMPTALLQRCGPAAAMATRYASKMPPRQLPGYNARLSCARLLQQSYC